MYMYLSTIVVPRFCMPKLIVGSTYKPLTAYMDNWDGYLHLTLSFMEYKYNYTNPTSCLCAMQKKDLWKAPFSVEVKAGPAWYLQTFRRTYTAIGSLRC